MGWFEEETIIQPLAINEDIPLAKVDGKARVYKIKRVCIVCKKSFFTTHQSRTKCLKCAPKHN